MSSVVYLVNMYTYEFIDFGNCSVIMYNVNIKRSWLWAYGNALYNFCNFALSLKLFQDKKSFKNTGWHTKKLK